MTYRTDPTRWTHSPDEAPELLQSALVSANREGPSDLQMRTLALKLAALSAGTAIAAASGTAHASTAAAGSATGVSATAAASAASGGMSVFAKVAVSIALVGAAATGTVYLRKPTALQGRSADERAAVVQTARPHVTEAPAEAVAIEAAPTGVIGKPRASVTPLQPTRQDSIAAVPQSARPDHAQDNLAQPALQEAATQPAQTAGEAAVVAEQAPVRSQAVDAEDGAPPSRKSLVGRKASAARSSVGPSTRDQSGHTESARVASAPAKRTASIRAVSREAAQPKEIELLRGARAALAARPQEAYRLTEQHRALYPKSVFVQEREALAIEALLRAGNLRHAQELAEGFVKRYPSSPHAHRFRETMKLP
jgi:hypothetical protein